jgi:hypothetical protein
MKKRKRKENPDYRNTEKDWRGNYHMIFMLNHACCVQAVKML